MCKYCNGRKTMPIFDWYDGRLTGSRKCVCNGGGWYPYYDWIAEKSAQQGAAAELPTSAGNQINTVTMDDDGRLTAASSAIGRA